MNVQYGVTLDDDEDLTSYVSGSGSGDDAFEEDVPTRIDENTEIVIPDKNQPYSMFYFSHFTKVHCFNPFPNDKF